MAVVEQAKGVPTLEDARRAAEACGSDPRVRKVSVFGSVARGEARPDSDIDLLVLIDTTWGKRASEVKHDIQRAVETAACCPCDLMLRTSAVWKHLSENVSASVEASIHSDMIDLLESDYDEDEGDANDMGDVVKTNDELIEESLRAVIAQQSLLQDVLSNIPSANKKLASMGLSDAKEQHMQARFSKCLTIAHLGIELSIKAVGMLTKGELLPKIYVLDRLLSELPETQARSDLEKELNALRYEQDGKIVDWRMGPYPDFKKQMAAHTTAENAGNHIHVFLAFCEQVAHIIYQHTQVPAVLATADEMRVWAADTRSMGVDAFSLVHGG